MTRHFVRTHAPVNAEHAALLLQVGIDVSKFASKDVFWGEFTEDQIALLQSWSWVKSLDVDVQFQTFEPGSAG